LVFFRAKRSERKIWKCLGQTAGIIIVHTKCTEALQFFV
jgi:hypothetical protein